MKKALNQIEASLDGFKNRPQSKEWRHQGPYGLPEHVAQSIDLKVYVVIAELWAAELKEYFGQGKTHCQVFGLAVGQQRKEEILTILYTNWLVEQFYGSGD